MSVSTTMPTIIDVRTSGEYAEGHKEGAINFDVSRLSQGEMPELPLDTPIEVYCRSGARSAMAKNILEIYGFTNVTDTGGYDGD